MAMGNGDSTLEAILKNTTHTVRHSLLSVRSQLVWYIPFQSKDIHTMSCDPIHIAIVCTNYTHLY